MKKRHLFWIVPLVLIVAGGVALHYVAPGLVENGQNAVERDGTRTASQEARALHKTLNVADLHADSLLWKRDLLTRSDRGHVDVPRMVEGNLALQVFTTVTKSPKGQNYEANSSDAADNITLLALAQMWPPSTWQNLTERALYQAQKLYGFAERAPERLIIIENSDDLKSLISRRASGDEVVGGLLGTEGSHALSKNLDNISRLYDAGFRLMSLQHFFDNALGGSLHGSGKKGLTEFGKQAVRKMEDMGIMIDVSHSSENVVRDTLAIVKRPLIVSHTGTRGHCNTHRNISDDLMVEIANRGGLIGIGYWDAAICDYSPEGIAKAIQAAVALVGEDHVALGSDFDGAVTTKLDASELVLITEALLDLGMDEEIIRKVMGQNQIDFFMKNLPTGS
ncbi:dipeptidase [Hoeflea sp. TYP-13]|uniref:dipeptidase n=1 Tax=Hoeflea sp. TYP-13 TaxID=3230023 RepID=UPI0034C64380